MLYATKTLLQDEKILYFTKPHYIIFYPTVVWMLLAWLLFEFGYGFLLGELLLIISLFSFISSIINYYCSEYVITNRRIIMKIGFTRRRSLEVFLDRIEGIDINQSAPARLLNFGTVTIGGVGGSKNSFFYIPKPLEFRAKVQEVVHQ